MKKLLSLMLLFLFFQFAVYGETAIAQDTKIVLKRGACYGECPVYALTIFADGKVFFEGQKYVKVLGRQEKKISDDQLRQLLQKFSEIGFPALTAKAAALECYTSVTDVPSTEVSITENGKSFTMIHGSKCYGDKLFQKLDDLAKTIDQIVDVNDWISLPEPK